MSYPYCEDLETSEYWQCMEIFSGCIIFIREGAVSEVRLGYRNLVFLE